MSITDHEKELQLHCRPSRDFLAVVPIKKRRIMLPHSPSSPNPPSPILSDCGVSESEEASSKLGPPGSKVGDNSVQGNVVTSEVTTCESHDPPLITTSDCGTGEKKSECPELGYNFSKSRGNHPPLNPAMGKVASCESRDLSSSGAADCRTTEKIQDSLATATPFLTGGGNPIQVNSLTGEDASCELCDLPSPTPSGCDISEKKPEYSEEQESPFLPTRGNFAKVNSVHASSESCKEPRSIDLNIRATHGGVPPSFSNQGSGSILAAAFMDGTCNIQGIVLNNKCATWTGVGSATISLATKQAFEVPGREGNFNGKFWSSEGISVKQEDVGLQNIQSMASDTKNKADSSHLCLNRSNWDLNRTMDAWEGSSADSLPNGGSAKSLELSLKQSLFNKHRESADYLRNYDLQKRHRFPNMCASKIDSNLETCLDLQLKPSFLSTSCNTSGKHDTISELPLLSLGIKPVLATCGSPSSFGRIVKSEPIESNHQDTGIVLKWVKSEPCDERETSKATISANVNLACSGALKRKPPEEQSQGCGRTFGGSTFHIGQKTHCLVPQSRPMHQNAVDNDSQALDVASEARGLNSVLRTCTSRPNTYTFNNSSDEAGKVQDLVNRAPSAGNDKSSCAVPTQDGIGIHMEPSALVSKLQISDVNDTNSLLQACETSSLPRASLPENLTSNGEGVDNSEGAPELLVQLEPSSSHPSSNVTSTDDLLQNPCGYNKVVESDKVEGEVGAEEPCETTVNTVYKHSDQDDEDYKDGEMRYPTLNDTAEGPSLVKSADSFSPVDAPVPITFVVDSSKESSALGSKKNDGSLIDNKVEPSSSAVVELTAESDKRTLRKFIPRTVKDHPENDKGLEKELKSSSLVTKTILLDNQNQNAERVSLAKNYDSCKIDHFEKEGAAKGANDGGNNRRIIYLNSAPNFLASGKKRSSSDRCTSSRGPRKRHFDRSFRNESVKTRSRRAKNERHHGHHIENLRSDLLPVGSRADRNANHDHISEKRNTSAGTRCSSDFSSRQMRKLKNEEPLSRVPFQRRSPGRRLQIPLGRHPTREISPRCIRIDVPDFVLLGHEDTLYERDEGIILCRERRSLSPQLRRGGPLHLAPNCTGSQQQHSTRQRSPPRRSSDGFNVPQELVRRRSPQVIRLNRMRSPHEEMMVRRRASLNYDMVDAGPSREQDFPSPTRGSNRNMGIFDMIDPREVAEEEYFDLHAVDNRVEEFGVDDEFVEDGGCSERRLPICESFRFHDEDGRNPRALGFNPEAKEDFREDRGPGDFNVRFRNRLGNSSGRFRGIVEEQEDNRRLHEGQEWRDATFNGARTKRRRF